jgi:hypothetical protein
MSFGNQCFDSFKPILSARELSDNKRNATIYGNVVSNVTLTGNANPIKTNHYQYNNRISLKPGSCLNSAASYEVLRDYEAGKRLLTEPPQGRVNTPKYENWCGNLYYVNYQQEGLGTVVKVVDASNIVVDPSNLLFYAPCQEFYPNVEGPAVWTQKAELDFTETYYAQAANGTIFVDASCNICSCTT